MATQDASLTLSLGMPSIDPENAPEAAYVPLDRVVSGHLGPVKIMICRQWKVSNPSGNHCLNVYLASDNKGNVIQMISKITQASQRELNFVDGEVYSLLEFTLLPSNRLFTNWNIDSHLMRITANTMITKLTCPTEGFIRHPFKLSALEDIHAHRAAYNIDVIGFVANMGAVCPTLIGGVVLHFDLVDDRGILIKTMLRGRLCAALISKQEAKKGILTVILTGMTPKQYDGQVYLACTCATAIYTGEDIPHIKDYEARVRNDGTITSLSHAARSLTQALYMARAHKAGGNRDTATVNCLVTVENIREVEPWYYYTCGDCHATKAVDEVDDVVWCGNCEAISIYALPRMRLHLDVSDETSTVTVVFPNDMVESLLGKTAAEMVKDAHDANDKTVIPQAIRALLNTKHVLELRTHTYQDFGTYESFLCSAIVDPIINPQLGVLSRTRNGHPVPRATPTYPPLHMHKSHDGEGSSTMHLTTPAKHRNIKKSVVILSSDEE